MTKKAVSMVEYALIFLVSCAVVVTIINNINPNAIKGLFEATVNVQEESGSQVNIGPMTE